MRAVRLFAITVVLGTGCYLLVGRAVPNIGGTWAYQTQDLAGAGTSCTDLVMTLVITESENTFTGTTNAGSVSCSGAGVPAFTVSFPAGVIANGTIARVRHLEDGNAITFDIGTTDNHHIGTWGKTSLGLSPEQEFLSGAVTMRVDTAGAAVTLNGRFLASRR